MRVCPKCGYTESFYWRQSRWKWNSDFTELENFKLLNPKLAQRFEDGEKHLEDDVYVYRCSKNRVVHRMAKIDGGNDIYRRHGFTEHPKKVDPSQTKLLEVTT